MTITPEQLAKRKGRLCSSEAAAAAGVSPYETIRDLWLVKTGRVPPEDLENKDAVRNGIAAEPAILDRYVMDTGAKVVGRDSLEFEGVGERDHLLSHPDMVIDNDGTHEPVDAKLRRDDDKWGASGTDLVPFSELVQIYHQCLTMCAPRGHLAVWLCGFNGIKFRYYTVEIDDEIALRLLALWRTLWRCVQDDTDPGGAAGLQTLMRRRDWAESATMIDAALVQRYEAAASRVGELTKEKDEIKCRILNALGDAQYGVYEDDDGKIRAVGRRNGRYWIGHADKVLTGTALVRLGFDEERVMR